MKSVRKRLGLAVTGALFILMLASTTAIAAAPAYPTTAESSTGMVLTTISSSKGVLVNYTSAFSGNFSGFMYVDLTTSLGQTIYWNVASCTFIPGSANRCFVIISDSVPSGNYKATVFVTTSTGVPVSSTSSQKITI